MVTAQANSCIHCGAPIPTARQGDTSSHQFCCHGCETVYNLLHDQGLDYYYTLRDNGGIIRPDDLQPAPSDDHQVFEDQDFCAKHLHDAGNGLASCRLYVSGLHCAACVWLLEKMPSMVPGLEQARVHFGRNALDVTFQTSSCDLATIARCILRLGYQAHPWNGAHAEKRAQQERRHWAMRFAVAGASMMATMHLAVTLFAGDITQDLDPGGRNFMGWLSFIACLPAISWCAMPYHRAALGALRARRATLDLTVSSVLLSGFLISTIHLLLGRHDLYFDAMAMFIFFLLAGRLVYIQARDRVMGDGAALNALLPQHATRLNDDGSPQTIAVDSLRRGDRIQLTSGAFIPVDGRITDGAIDCDCAMLSGESVTKHIGPGGEVFAGTQVVHGQAQCEVESTGTQSRMGQLISSIVHANASSTAISDLVDRILSWFAPIVAALALLTFAMWYVIASHQAWDQTIAVVIVACPCALGLAAPLIQAICVSRAAKQGILIRDAAVSEVLPNCRHAILDKTGTLSTGEMIVENIIVHGNPIDFEQRTSQFASLAQHSGHPINRALTQHLATAAPPVTVHDFTEVPGQGIRGTMNGQLLSIGRAEWINDQTEAPPSHKHSVVYLGLNGRIVAHAECVDPLKPEAAALITSLRDQGMTPHICSGDSESAVRKAADELGIPSVNTHFSQSPEDKQHLVKALQQDGPVMMLGDGINDAAALAEADVGIGMRGGLEATLQVSAIFLIDNALSQVNQILHGARQARRSLRSALMWSILYNIIGISAAMIGWWGPWICAIAMPLSSLTIIAIAVTSRSFTTKTEGNATPI